MSEGISWFEKRKKPVPGEFIQACIVPKKAGFHAAKSCMKTGPLLFAAIGENRMEELAYA